MPNPPRHMPSVIHLFVGLSLTLLAVPPAAAQITGSISGVVRDESGAALPGATVVVRGGSLPRDGRTAAAGLSGAYRLALLPPGAYDVEVRFQSFGTQVRKSVEVALDAETRLDFVLRPAGLRGGGGRRGRSLPRRHETIGNIDAHHGADHRLPAPERPRVRGPREAGARRHPGDGRQPRRRASTRSRSSARGRPPSPSSWTGPTTTTR